MCEMNHENEHERQTDKKDNQVVLQTLKFTDLNNPYDVIDYLDDTGTDWGVDLGNITFTLREIRLLDLEKAISRPLALFSVDKGMVGQTKSTGPILLDQDLSVIDGMHRLSDELEITDPYQNPGASCLAYVRDLNESRTVHRN